MNDDMVTGWDDGEPADEDLEFDPAVRTAVRDRAARLPMQYGEVFDALEVPPGDPRSAQRSRESLALLVRTPLGRARDVRSPCDVVPPGSGGGMRVAEGCVAWRRGAHRVEMRDEPSGRTWISRLRQGIGGRDTETDTGASKVAPLASIRVSVP